MNADEETGRTKPICAYCGQVGTMTKEHILPRFLFRQFPTQKTGYNARADKFMTGEPQVRDVCAACNSGPLSSLDAYASSFLSKIRCERTYISRVELAFEYNFSLLLRWLLKVSYNSARTRGETPTLLRECIPFVRDDQGEHPPVVFLAVEVVRDTPVDADQRARLPKEIRHWTHIPARMFRVGQGAYPRARQPHAEYILRFVAINAWYFTFCIVPFGVDRSARRRIAVAHRSFLPDSVLLAPPETQARVRVSRRTEIDAYTFQALRVKDRWYEYIRAKYPDRAI